MYILHILHNPEKIPIWYTIREVSKKNKNKHSSIKYQKTNPIRSHRYKQYSDFPVGSFTSPLVESLISPNKVQYAAAKSFSFVLPRSQGLNQCLCPWCAGEFAEFDSPACLSPTGGSPSPLHSSSVFWRWWSQLKILACHDTRQCTCRHFSSSRN